MIFTHLKFVACMLMRLRDDHVANVSVYTYKHNTYTYIHRYVFFSCSTDKCGAHLGSPQLLSGSIRQREGKSFF